MKVLLIAGASGHGKVVADIAWKLNKYHSICFMDDDDTISELMGIPVIGKITTDFNEILAAMRKHGMLENDHLQKENVDIVIAIGNSKIRQEKQEKFEEQGYTLPVLIHPSAILGIHVQIEAGSVVMAQAVINPDTRIGKGCIINTTASVDHDNRIGDYSHVSVGAHLAGTVCIGNHTWIGAGAVVKNNIYICDACMIGAGAVVVKDMKESGTYIGVPAKKIIE